MDPVDPDLLRLYGEARTNFLSDILCNADKYRREPERLQQAVRGYTDWMLTLSAPVQQEEHRFLRVWLRRVQSALPIRDLELP